jgi:hypothetical protein
MLPLFQALVCKVRGDFEWNALKPVFGFFYLSMLISTFRSATVLVSRPVALAATALLALTPAVSTRFSVGGYADMPQAALVAGLTAALLGLRSPSKIGFHSPVPWLVGGLMLVKSEGIVLALIVCSTIVACRLPGAVGEVKRDCYRHRVGIALVFGCFALRWLSLVWLQSQDPTYGPLDWTHLLRAYQNLMLVPQMCLNRMLNVSEWGVFWPAFLSSVVILAVMGTWRERALAGAALAAVFAYTLIFYLTNWDIKLHVEQAYSRLLVQVAPAASVAVACAYERLAGCKHQPLLEAERQLSSARGSDSPRA